MARWEPDARGRLQRAALDLFVERGFEQTTVAEIAERAGVTERTFFRYFPDKREVLFSGQDDLRDVFVGAVADAPADAAPLEVMIAALDAAATWFPAERRDFARQRQSVIDANASLQERELLKLAHLATALAGALRARRVEPSTAGLTGEMAMAVFKMTFARWIDGPDRGDFVSLQRETLDVIADLLQLDVRAQ